MTKTKERITLLDIIRGISLFGIFLVNMPSFHSPDFIYSFFGLQQQYYGFDNILSYFYQLFIQMKIYPIFSFLFGVSFWLFLSKHTEKLFLKRMIFLFLFGLCHLIFLWHGDILHIYAASGVLLLFFRKLPSKLILFWSIFLLAMYHLFLLFIACNIESTQSTINPVQKQTIVMYTEIYQHATYFEWILYRINIEVIPVLSQLPLSMLPIFAFFMLGLFCGNENLFTHSKKNDDIIKKIRNYSMMISVSLLILKIILQISSASQHENIDAFNLLLTSLSGVSLSIFYMCVLYRLTNNLKWKRLFIPFSFVGRMALTNYVLQSFISFLIFRFFHYYGKISLSEGTLLCIAIFSFQALFSYFWLTFFSHGPLEHLWRKLASSNWSKNKNRNKKIPIGKY